MECRIVPAYANPDEIRALFSEYTDMLIQGDPKFKTYLDIQNYDKELQDLEEKYGLPRGRLFIAYYGDKAAGCIALKRTDTDHCELKRLYVRPEFRGHRIGEKLVEKIIEAAREIGYSHILLDTLPFLQTAIALYKQFGFYEIDCYNNSPMDNSIYMRYDL